MSLTLEAPTVDTPAQLRAAYVDARRNGATRHRDIAESLGVSEGELIAAHAGMPAAAGQTLIARRLAGDWPQQVAGFEAFGPVMALTRNASCVHEKEGVYGNVSVGGQGAAATGLVLGGAIDLRLFYRRWFHGFAVDELGPKGLTSSLQFFDAHGVAVHKLFSRAHTDRGAWVEHVARWLADDQRSGLRAEPTPARATERPDAAVDAAGLREAWAGLRDTHEFFGLLKRFEVTRTQALRLADPRFAQPVELDSARHLLHAASAGGVPVMVFVGNRGAIQIHSGPVHRIVSMGPWLNVLDAGFNLHLREDRIAAAWVVRKPTSDGLVSSLELFDADGEAIAMFFGERKPGRPELCAWRELLEGVAPGGAPEGRPCAC